VWAERFGKYLLGVKMSLPKKLGNFQHKMTRNEEEISTDQKSLMDKNESGRACDFIIPKLPKFILK